MIKCADNPRISPISPPSPPASNLSTTDIRNGGDISSDGGDIISTIGKVSPPKEARNDAQFDNSGDIFRLPLGGDSRTTGPLLESRDYVAFDLEWTSNNDTGNNRTIYAAAFVDNHGSQKVLQIADFLSPFWLL